MKQITFDEILAEAPQNFVIQNALEKCYNVVRAYKKNHVRLQRRGRQ